MRVLLVEDDPMIGDAIQGALKDASYAADWVKDGQTALTTLGFQHYDLVLLDLGLPGKDGLEVLASIRAKVQPDPPCLSSRRRDGLDDRLRGLDGGADDYVSKPFQMAELLARMRAVLRRKGGTAVPVPQQRRSVTRSGHERGQRQQRLLAAIVQPRVRAAASLAGSTWGHPLTQRAGGSHLWLGRRGRKQRRRISDPRTAAQAGQRGHQERQGDRMDGIKRRLNESVQLKLSFTLSLAILVVAIVAGVFSFLSAL